MNAELLKSMLQDIINDRQEQAAVTMHEYFVAKTREVTGLAEAKEATIVVVDAEFEYITDTDSEKQGSVKLFQTCKTAAEAEKLVKKIKDLGEGGIVELENDDLVQHWGQNSYDNFMGAYGANVYLYSPKIVSKEPTGRRVFAFNAKDLGL